MTYLQPSGPQPQIAPVMPTRFLALTLLAFSLVCGCSNVHADSNLILNPGFEEGAGSWGIFVPAESQDKECQFLISKDSPHSGSACAELKSGSFARFSIGPKSVLSGPIAPGDRFHLTYWIRAAKDAHAKGTPGFIVRIFLADSQGQTAPGNQAFFVGLNGQSNTQSPQAGVNLAMFPDPLPTEWTKVEAVIEVPADFQGGRLGRPEFFAQYTMGSIFLDDVSLERLEKEAPPATPGTPPKNP